LDETLVLELLQLESEDIIDRYEDIIINNFTDLEIQLEDVEDGEAGTYN